MKKALTSIILILAVVFISSSFATAATVLFKDDFERAKTTNQKWWTSNQDERWGDWDETGIIKANTSEAPGVYTMAIDNPTMDYNRYVYAYANNYSKLIRKNTLTTFDFMQKSVSDTSYDGLDIWFEKGNNEDLYYDFNIEVNTQIFAYHLPGMADETYVEMVIPVEFGGIILRQGEWYTMSVGFWDWGTVCTVSEQGGDDLFSVVVEACTWGKVRTALDSYGDPAYFDNFKVKEYSNSISQPETPVPGAVWLLGSGMLGMLGLKRRNKK